MTIGLPHGTDHTQGKLINGWNPDTGKWSQDESMGVVPRMFGNLRRGAGETNAALNAGVSYQAVHGWREKGKEIARNTAATERMELAMQDRIYVDFAIELATAIATHETDLVEIISQGAVNDPDLALKILSRRHTHWREQKGVDVTSKGESVVVQDNIARILTENPEIAAKGEELALLIAGAAGKGELDEDE